jgi:glycosyltransferase involved in cell wall biosynthesis
MRIALFTTAGSWRGSGVVFAELTRGLAGRGHETRALVATEAVRNGFGRWGVEARALPIGRTGLSEARDLARWLAAGRIEVVLADKARDVRLAALASFVHPHALVHCISTPTPPTDWRTRLAARRLRLTVFLTERLARIGVQEAPWLSRIPRRIIPNGVDCAQFRPDAAAGRVFRDRWRLGEGPLLVGVGALVPEKRWDVLLAALPLLPAPAPALVLCGSGPLQAALETQAGRLGMEVRFTGALAPAELVLAYNAATCVVNTRPDEVFALSLLEALACGRPIVAVAGGGTPELLGEAGVLVPPDDPTALATACAALLAHPDRRETLGIAARARAVEYFSLDRMLDGYAEAIASLPASAVSAR